MCARQLQLDDVARFLSGQLQERAEEYRQDPERLDLREDAIDLAVLKDLLLSGAIPASTGVRDADIPRLVPGQGAGADGSPWSKRE